MNAQSAIDEAV